MVDKSKRLIFVTALAISILGASMYGVHEVAAQDTTVQNTIVQKIAEKFGLQTKDVQAVFDQEREERMKEMEARYEQSLTDAVSKGELTEEKKQLILAKHKEIESYRKTEMESLQTLSAAERKAAMDTKKAELKNWADTNGVDLKYLVGGFGKGGRHGGFPGQKKAQ